MTTPSTSERNTSSARVVVLIHGWLTFSEARRYSSMSATIVTVPCAIAPRLRAIFGPQYPQPRTPKRSSSILMIALTPITYEVSLCSIPSSDCNDLFIALSQVPYHPYVLNKWQQGIHSG